MSARRDRRPPSGRVFLPNSARLDSGRLDSARPETNRVLERPKTANVLPSSTFNNVANNNNNQIFTTRGPSPRIDNNNSNSNSNSNNNTSSGNVPSSNQV
jgi:hypothetical protein